MKTFVVTSRSENALGTADIQEVLSLVPDGKHWALRVSKGNGSTFSLPVALTAQGEIDLNSQNRGVTCYNMAMNALAHIRAGNARPAAVFVQFDASVVRIPLYLRAQEAHGAVRSVTLDGRSDGLLRVGDGATPAGIIIHANVTTDNGNFAGAMFDEVHYAGTPARVIGRSTCTLERATAVPITAVTNT